MKMTNEEKNMLTRLLTIFHDSGMTAKEAGILALMLKGPENVEILLERLEEQPQIDKRVIYLETVAVLKGIDSFI